MKRFHVHLSVDDLAKNIRFYTALFGVAPDVEKPDYAKWLLDDPRVNFAISRRGRTAGVNHLGFQVESDHELKGMRERAVQADIQALDESGANCCYATSDKYWVRDPQGVAWETFHTLGEIPVFGGDSSSQQAAGPACCVPHDAADDPPSRTSGGCCA